MPDKRNAWANSIISALLIAQLIQTSLLLSALALLRDRVRKTSGRFVCLPVGWVPVSFRNPVIFTGLLCKIRHTYIFIFSFILISAQYNLVCGNVTILNKFRLQHCNTERF